MSINLKGQIDDVLKGTVDLLTGGGSAVIESKSIFANGVYNAPSGVDGYNPVIVDVPAKIEKTLSVTENGTYTPEEGQVYNGVIVNVQQSQPVIQAKTITENGTYTAPSGVDGFSPVTVQVAPLLEDRYINANGQYGPTEGYDGIRFLTVEVPVPTITPVTLTENGTYTDPQGNGCNPITVAVPSVASVIVDKYPIVNNRTLQPAPCTLTQGKYYALYYYDDYLFPRLSNVLGCTAFSRILSGSTEQRFFMDYNNTNKDWYCTDGSIYLKTKFDNDVVNAYVTVLEIDSSVINNLLPT